MSTTRIITERPEVQPLAFSIGRRRPYSTSARFPSVVWSHADYFAPTEPYATSAFRGPKSIGS